MIQVVDCFLILKRTTDSAGKQRVAPVGVTKLPPSIVERGSVCVHFEIEIEDTLIEPVFPTKMKLVVDPAMVDSKVVVAGLKKIKDEVKDI